MSTVRPSEDAAVLADRMSYARVTRVAMTRADDALIGLFSATDVNS